MDKAAKKQKSFPVTRRKRSKPAHYGERRMRNGRKPNAFHYGYYRRRGRHPSLKGKPVEQSVTRVWFTPTN